MRILSLQSSPIYLLFSTMPFPSTQFSHTSLLWSHSPLTRSLSLPRSLIHALFHSLTVIHFRSKAIVREDKIGRKKILAVICRKYMHRGKRKNKGPTLSPPSLPTSASNSRYRRHHRVSRQFLVSPAGTGGNFSEVCCSNCRLAGFMMPLYRFQGRKQRQLSRVKTATFTILKRN